MTSYPRRQVGDGDRDVVVVVWWSRVPGPVRAMPVIVRDILIQDRPQVPRPGDQHPVSDYSPRCPHPAFGVRRDSVTGSYIRVTGSADLLAAARELSVKTMIFDVEPYQGLPRPGAVAGDQLPTDGVLAYRLRFTFLHYTPKLSGVPLGPALMHRWGELVRPLLFRRSATDR